MNPCALDMLHNTRDKHGFAIADRVNLCFLAKHITVDEYGMLRVDFNSNLHIAQQLFIGIDDFHCSSG
ncbi:hypothetical protein D3C80_2158890 [compost metagenome]